MSFYRTTSLLRPFGMLFYKTIFQTGLTWMSFYKMTSQRRLKGMSFYRTTSQTEPHAAYTGFPIRPRSSMPLMAAKERDEIVGQSPSPTAGVFDVSSRGHAFSWHEKKPIEWYKTFLAEIKATLVIDVTPGSGALARACLDEGIQYIGVRRSNQHMSWLVNVLDRASVESTVRQGTALYD